MYCKKLKTSTTSSQFNRLLTGKAWLPKEKVGYLINIQIFIHSKSLPPPKKKIVLLLLNFLSHVMSSLDNKNTDIHTRSDF